MIRSSKGEIYLGGRCILIPFDYHCKDFKRDLFNGYENLDIKCSDENLTEYVKYKIDELIYNLKDSKRICVKSIDELKDDLMGFDDEEFDAFLTPLEKLNYLFRPREGYIRLTRFDDLKIMKDYCDDGKFAAPRWLVYPHLSLWTIGWRMGVGENYVMNMPHETEGFQRLFPKPRYWEYDKGRFIANTITPLGYFWRDGGRPEYPKASTGIEVNAFITMDDEKGILLRCIHLQVSE